MSKVLPVFVILILLQIQLIAQTQSEQIISLYEAENFESIIDLKIENPAKLTAHDSFLIGMSFYNLSKDKEAMPHFARAVELKKDDAEYNFFLGISYLFLGEYEKAKESIEASSKVEPNSPLYKIALADVYYNTKDFEKAKSLYKEAQQIDDCPDRAFVMLGQILMEEEKYEEALDAYKSSLDQVDQFYGSFIDCLYNIGSLEYQLKKFADAKNTFSKLIELRPLDYEAMSKVIQCCYATDQLEEIDYWKNRIYDGYETKALPNHMADMFCFDQFTWNNQQVLAFEKFEQPDAGLFYKHIFYLIDSNGDIDYSVQTEHSEAVISFNKYYVLGKSDKNGHSSFFDYLFDKELEYNELKQAVIDIFEDKTKASVSSSKKKKKRRSKKKKKQL